MAEVITKAEYRKRRSEESKLQQHCVKWFKYQYPKYSKLLFAIPNGGSRNIKEAAKLKREGVVAGISDLILLLANKHYNCLCLETKTKEKYSRQSESQKQWQKEVENNGSKYVVFRNFDEFEKIVIEYINNII
jgi:hypothetical protein